MPGVSSNTEDISKPAGVADGIAACLTNVSSREDRNGACIYRFADGLRKPQVELVEP